MAKLSSPVPSRPPRKALRAFAFPAVALAASAAVLISIGSCGNPSQQASDGLVAENTAGSPANTTPDSLTSGQAAGPSGPGNGSPVAAGPQNTATGAGTSSVAPEPGSVPPGGDQGQGNGGTSPGAVTPVNPGSGPTGNEPVTPAETCEDVLPPPDPEWPDATCAQWAAETEECTASWFANYCDISCGRCVPEGSDGTPAPEPCEDILPPPDPEWPDATCDDWAVETDECSASWFANYCDISCGRCVPEGGMSVPEPEPCEDVLPPPDPMWPDANCETWAFETDECGADWFRDYCDISCGRCIPEGGSPLPTAPDCSGEGLPNVTGGEGFATRYWDCCQTHCAQQTGHRCGEDGVSGSGDQNSACSGGGAFACYDEAPRAVSECLAYGHIAKASPNCGACYRIQFTGVGEHNPNDMGSKLIAGKQMIVKVTNTGGDVAGNQFDLMVPGGGVGQFNACSRQWGTDDLGAQYGGFLADCKGTHAEKKECVRQECMKIPAGSARDGCIWFVDWFEVADNPKFTSQQTDCPF